MPAPPWAPRRLRQAPVRSAWYGAIVTILLFLIGYVLGFRQGDIQAEQHSLQRSLGNLELQEKITCFNANSVALQNDSSHLDRAFNLAGDARAAAELFSHADDDAQRRFLEALQLALTFVPNPVVLHRPNQRTHLVETFQELRQRLHDVVPAEGLAELMRRVDARLAILTGNADHRELEHLRRDVRVMLDWDRFRRDDS